GPGSGSQVAIGGGQSTGSPGRGLGFLPEAPAPLYREVKEESRAVGAFSTDQPVGLGSHGLFYTTRKTGVSGTKWTGRPGKALSRISARYFIPGSSLSAWPKATYARPSPCKTASFTYGGVSHSGPSPAITASTPSASKSGIAVRPPPRYPTRIPTRRHSAERSPATRRQGRFNRSFTCS